MRIRGANAADLPAASQLWLERLFLLQQSDNLIQPSADARADWLQAARGWLAGEDSALFVAESAGELVGVAAVDICDGEVAMQPARLGRLLALAVDLHEAHPALSSRLLGKANDWLRGQGVTTLQIDAPAAYPVETAFWRGQGARLRSNRYWLSL